MAKRSAKTRAAPMSRRRPRTASAPVPASNLNGCPFRSEDFSGDNLSGFKMIATNFRDAPLVGTNLSSSNAKGGVFRGPICAGPTCAPRRSPTPTSATPT